MYISPPLLVQQLKINTCFLLCLPFSKSSKKAHVKVVSQPTRHMFMFNPPPPDPLYPLLRELLVCLFVGEVREGRAELRGHPPELFIK